MTPFHSDSPREPFEVERPDRGVAKVPTEVTEAVVPDRVVEVDAGEGTYIGASPDGKGVPHRPEVYGYLHWNAELGLFLAGDRKYLLEEVLREAHKQFNDAAYTLTIETGYDLELDEASWEVLRSAGLMSKVGHNDVDRTNTADGQLHQFVKPANMDVETISIVDLAKVKVATYENLMHDVEWFTPEHFYVVWFTKILGNWKAIVSTDIFDNPDTGKEKGILYEVTYNGAKGEAYVDEYTKKNNVVIPD